MKRAILIAIVCGVGLGTHSRADWPMYRADAARSAYSAEPLPAELSLQWSYKARYAPQPAWPREGDMRFDIAFQPVASADTVFFGSSADGKLYALEAATGRERWTFFTDAPIRFAPVLWKDRVFVASDDGVLYCLAAGTGKELWRKRGGPQRDMVLGHGRPISRWPARGGPAIVDDVLYFGAGIWPAEGIYLYALDPQSGEVKWVNDTSGALVMEQPHGGNRAKNGVSIQGYLAVDEEKVFVPTGRGSRAAFDRATGALVSFRHSGRPSPYSGVSLPGKTEPCLIVVGDTMVSGGEESVSLSSMTSPQQETSKLPVDGKPLGLAATSGRLFVSTDKGTIHCFASKVVSEPPTLVPTTELPPATASAAADDIIKQTGVTEGYGLDLGCGDGSLALALAQKTDLYIVAVDADPKMVALACQRLDKAGLYGMRVTVLQADPAATPLPKHFANLVVSGRALAEGMAPAAEKEAMRILRPYGGIACIGKAGALAVNRRGPLDGAGEWTHQYADAANSNCSDDGLVKAPLGMLWFTDFGITMPNRHGRGPSPLFKDGMLVVEGVDGLFGVDAYNGRIVWDHPIKGILQPYNQEHLLGTAGTHGNMCAADGSVFVRHKDKCLRLDLQTGKKQQEYVMPGGRWGFIACDDGMLFGSRADTNYVPRYLYGRSKMDDMLTQSAELFAFDRKSGRVLWSYKAERSIRHNTIAVGNGSVFLIDSALIDADRLKKLEKQEPLGSTLLCLDARTGKERWQQTNDIYGTTLILSVPHKMLVMGYQHSQREFQFGSEKGNRLTGFNAATGARAWDVTMGGTRYISRPLINGSTIYAQPLAWDLMTGEKIQDYVMKGRQPGGCGNISGSQYLLLYRSGPLSYIDLTQAEKVNQTYGPMRPGCWINAIPAGGLVLMPDASDGCRCTYLMKVSVGLQAMKEQSPLRGD